MVYGHATGGGAENTKACGGSTQIICPSRSHGIDWEKSFRLDGFYEPIIELCLTHLGLGVLDPHCQMTYSPY